MTIEEMNQQAITDSEFERRRAMSARQKLVAELICLVRGHSPTKGFKIWRDAQPYWLNACRRCCRTFEKPDTSGLPLRARDGSYVD